ncbi:hypothetical protein CSC74_11005 [Pseudoxanthomonas yeongjuensis]|uniref:autotransporter outer membrane beta-barrel domain-containing protein n=1 Tax=Pseudoxanthomonas yeongjuensis TaxID=377616 RepID=UPI0013912852|nr:autotransporter outer membrane beta-barrel domain-containing protein [Pseudoxanthomonas yeongjuensis]KAF1716362.1 hypothetical protein CSC74_11005 [Pseudoxanthomonas yeongjuensis]
MRGNTNGRLRKARGARIYKLAPTTRAVRAVLAGSATFWALALAGNGVAYAGTCLSTDATTVSCNGDITETLPGTLFVPPIDMTLVLGDAAPTSVTTAMGEIGVDATWSGSIGIVSNADITTDGGDGVHVYGSTPGAGATFENLGSVDTSVTLDGANAVDIDAYGDVTIANASDLAANGAGSYDVTTVAAYSVEGVTTIDNLATGTIAANASDGNALAVSAFGFYGSVVNNDGAIVGTSVNGTATGVFVEAFADALGGGIADASNTGSIDVSSTNSQAIGISAYAGSTSAAIDNAGTITATGYGLAVGISTYATGTTAIDSSGTIAVTAIAGDAFGISAASDWDSISIVNSGDISADGSNAAAAILSAGYRGDIDNSGAVTASAANGTASGILAQDYYSSNISSDGGIHATSLFGDAVGVDASTALLVAVDNTGAISVDGANNATGIIAASLFGTHVGNSGTITASAEYGNAAGVIAEVLGGPYAYENAVVDNSGSISATSNIGDASGIQLTADLPFAVVYNSGSVSAASSQGAATGIGVQTDASISSSYVLSSGSVDAAAGGDHGFAQGISAYANDGDSFVVTSGTVSATAGLSGTAYGVMALSQNGSTTVDNSGDIDVATTPMGVVQFTTDLDYATGIYAGSEDLSTVTNSGSITVDGGWQALGIEVRADDGLVSVSNGEAGTINVTGSRTATGISTFVDSFGRDPYTNAALIDNAGSISVTTTGEITDPAGYAFLGNAIGIDAFLFHGEDVTITNSGSISIDAAGVGKGIHADTVGEVLVTNSGSIAITGSGSNSSYGIEGVSVTGDISLVNSSGITILSSALSAADVATGLDASALSLYAAGDASVVNTGDIIIDGAFTAFGVHADAGLLGTGNVTVSNVGDITLAAVGNAWGVDTMLWKYDGDTIVDNTGNITVTGTDARGMRVGQASSVGDIHITNSGDIDATAISPANPYGYAYGAIGVFARRYAFGDGGVVTVDNTGSISAIADIGDSNPGFRGAHAHGVKVFTYGNDIDVSNAGSILAELAATGPTAGSALGVFVKNGYGTSFGDIGISNTGSIETSVTSNDAVSPFTFLYYSGAYTAGVHARATYGDVDVINAGSINASALSDYNADAGVTRASGISVLSKVGTGTERDFDLGDLTVANAATGSIRAHSQADIGESVIIATGISALVSVGTYGSLLASAGHGITIDNTGLVSAIAVTGEGATGTATATGISAANGSTQGFADVSNTGRLNAEATTTGTATAIGLFASAAEITIDLGPDSVITATATGADGTATGLSLSGGSITASNAGILQAEFIGADGSTYGAHIASTTGAADFSNSGTINATDADLAVGVQLDSLTSTTLINSGTINAFSAAGRGIAVRTGDSTDLIQNTGTLNGALVTNGGNDTLDNGLGGVWHAIGSSDFGSGTDTITNAGTIFLDNAAITLGDSATFDNAFTSNGLIRVSGDNTIDLGAQNTLAFSNSGILDFRDGAADDILTINGDFGGSGAINLDVSGLNTSSDLLYVNGNIAAGSTSTINVSLMALPTTQTASMPLVYVSGDSTATSFQLGEVRYDPDQNFLTLTYNVDLEAAIDTTNATLDVFSLGMKVSGLSDSGTLAATIAPGAQSLLSSQVGTWRQRMGVIDKFRQGGVALWARLFQDSGVVSPQHTASNFGQDGNFAFDQRNSGTEVGADFAISDALSVGLLAGKSDARQRLQGTGLGTSTIEGDTYGAYATWISPIGFYVDASYRHMSLDAKLKTSAGEIRTSGNANALSLEGGYAWTLDNGLKIEPQVQYTRITVDDIDALSGQLASFQSEGGDSSRGRIGVMFRKGFGSGSAVWTPYASVNAVREFDGKNGFSINEDFSGETHAEGTNALVEAGLNVDIGRLSVFGSANWQDGGALESIVTGQVGVRFAW